MTKIVGGQKTGDESEVLDLGWAHKSEKSNARDIPPSAFFHMDVATLHLLPDGRKVLRPPNFPNTKHHILEGFFCDQGHLCD